MKPQRGRPTLRQTREANNKSLTMYAGLSGRELPADLLNDIKPKRLRSDTAKSKERVGRGSEHAEQCAVIAWWRKWNGTLGVSERLLFAVPNGGARDEITGSRMKAEGVRRGTPDLFLATMRDGYGGLFIEMKYGKNKLSDEQSSFFSEAACYKCVTCWTAEEAIEAIKEYIGVEKK